MSGLVVVGAGQAGFQVAASAREAGFAAPITILGDEPVLPYQRPPLSKAFLAGKLDGDGLQLRPPAYFAEHDIALKLGAAVEGIERDARRVRLADGTSLAYGHLVLATGARNRPLPVPGADLPGVRQLRGLADAEALKAALATVRRVAVVGAGFIGLEFAAVAAARGIAVEVVEAASRPMARAVSQELAAHFLDAHRRAGVQFHLEAGVQAIAEGGGRAVGLDLADGRFLEADLVLVGIGVLPNDVLAADAGLPCADGIRVDAFLSTEDPAISAAGDCARYPSPYALDLSPDGTVRVESVQNAIDHGRCIAARLVGRPAPYASVPWFWSDQGPDKLQMAGLAAPGDAAVMRGSGSAFSVFRFRAGRLSAVESVNRPADHMIARRILSAGTPLSPAEASDPAFDLKGLIARG